MLRILLEHGATMKPSRNGSTPLTRACSYGFMNVVEFLIGNGADVNPEPDQDGYTPIIAAARRRRHEVVKFLLIQGADPFVYTKVGRCTSLC